MSCCTVHAGLLMLSLLNKAAISNVDATPTSIYKICGFFPGHISLMYFKVKSSLLMKNFLVTFLSHDYDNNDHQTLTKKQKVANANTYINTNPINAWIQLHSLEQETRTFVGYTENLLAIQTKIATIAASYWVMRWNNGQLIFLKDQCQATVLSYSSKNEEITSWRLTFIHKNKKYLQYTLHGWSFHLNGTLSSSHGRNLQAPRQGWYLFLVSIDAMSASDLMHPDPLLSHWSQRSQFNSH